MGTVARRPHSNRDASYFVGALFVHTSEHVDVRQFENAMATESAFGSEATPVFSPQARTHEMKSCALLSPKQPAAVLHAMVSLQSGLASQAASSVAHPGPGMSGLLKHAMHAA
jgi:hypothetical protein